MTSDESLEDRLRGHARAFDGLLALIPAKQYYSEDKSDQWQKKKQTKEEARMAKLAKLDPDNHKSVLDVVQEAERKRKREDEGLEELAEGSEKPREGLKVPKIGKKQKTASVDVETDKSAGSNIARQNKKERKKKQAQDKKARKEARKTQKDIKDQKSKADITGVEESEDQSEDEAVENNEADLSFLGSADLTTGEKFTRPGEDDQAKLTAKIAPSEGLKGGDRSTNSPSPESAPSNEVFSAQPSGTSSISSSGTASSLTPQGIPDQKDKTKSDSQASSIFNKSGTGPRLTMAEMQERLRQRIAEKRAQRHADVDGKPARTRAELIESRRKKQDQRKATKKALRQQAKEEEVRKREEAIAKGSPLMSPTVHSPPNGEASTSFSFGRIAFENGQMMTADLSAVTDLPKRKGPMDAKTALLKANAKDAQLAEMNDEKRAAVQEKQMWLNAQKRARGERIRDDSSLLKKTLKQKQKQKDKSANDWKKRIDGIKAAQESKQKKREENLAKRREEKGKKGSKSSKGKKPKKRPGFEGSFRSGGRK